MSQKVPQIGDRVKTKCTATGRYIGYGLALFVSAMCNDLCIDRVALDDEPHPDLPVPSDDAAYAAAEAVRHMRSYALAEQRAGIAKAIADRADQYEADQAYIAARGVRLAVDIAREYRPGVES